VRLICAREVSRRAIRALHLVSRYRRYRIGVDYRSWIAQGVMKSRQLSNHRRDTIALSCQDNAQLRIVRYHPFSLLSSMCWWGLGGERGMQPQSHRSSHLTFRRLSSPMWFAGSAPSSLSSKSGIPEAQVMCGRTRTMHAARRTVQTTQLRWLVFWRPRSLQSVGLVLSMPMLQVSATLPPYQTGRRCGALPFCEPAH